MSSFLEVLKESLNLLVIYIYNSNHSQPLSLSLQGVKLHFLKFKSQKGFSLVGVLVTSVLGIIIFQGVFTMQSVTMKSTKQIEGKLQSASINRAILETLSEGKPEDTNCTTSSPAVPCESACTNTLKGSLLDGSVVEITKILTAYNETKYPAVTTPALDVGERVRYKKDDETSGVKINKIEFTGNKDTKQGELKVFYEFVVLGKKEEPAPFIFPVTIQTHQPNATDNTKEELLTCGIEAGSGGVEPDCYDVTETRTIVGCAKDEHNNIITTGENTIWHSTLIGFEAGKSSEGRYNTFIGYQAGKQNTSGRNNTFVGVNAGQKHLTGTSNTFIGENAGWKYTEGHNNIYIGSYFEPLEDNKSNQLRIGDWIKGDVKTYSEEEISEEDDFGTRDRQKTLTLLSSDALQKSLGEAKVVIEGSAEIKGSLTCTSTPCGQLNSWPVHVIKNLTSDRSSLELIAPAGLPWSRYFSIQLTFSHELTGFDFLTDQTSGTFSVNIPIRTIIHSNSNKTYIPLVTKGDGALALGVDASSVSNETKKLKLWIEDLSGNTGSVKFSNEDTISATAIGFY